MATNNVRVTVNWPHDQKIRKHFALKMTTFPLLEQAHELNEHRKNSYSNQSILAVNLLSFCKKSSSRMHYTLLRRNLTLIKVCKSILGKALSQIGTSSIRPHKETKEFFSFVCVCDKVVVVQNYLPNYF